MTAQTMAIEIPQSLYRRLERLAELSHRPLENVVVQTLNAGVPPLPDDLPTEMRDDLLALEMLDDEALWEVARSVVGPKQQEGHFRLLEKNQSGKLTLSEQAKLAQFRLEADQLMLRKAYAYTLLKWRGYRLPSLADLEAQE